MFDAIEKALHEVAGFVHMRIELAWLLAVGSRRNHSFGLLLMDRVDESTRVIGLVGDDFLGRNSLKQRLGLGYVMRLSSAERPACWVAQRIDQCMNLRRQSAAGSPDGLVTVFFSAPAPC